MKDFGTALIFFFTFIVIAFMRSGDVRTIALVCVAALLGAIMIVYFKPHVAARFKAYRHIWELINDEGMQQTRTLIYSASGGLFGLGIGKGMLRNVVFASTDLAFGMICEEWGMIVGLTIVITYAFILLYAIKVARKYAFDKYGDESHSTIITLKNSFHGRTIATLKATGQDVFHTDFGPFPEGFVYAEANNFDDVKKFADTDKCIAVMMELVPVSYTHLTLPTIA